jgi:amino acid transporter
VVGWGPAKINSYGSDPAPWVTMAGRVWGPFQVIVILAILNSALANANAGVNAATRVMYAMGRTHTLPTIFSRLNQYRVPDIAIFFAMAIALVCGLVPGFIYGPLTAFALLGTIIILPIILVYIATCVSVPVFYLHEHPSEFNVLRHIVVPLIPLIIMLFVLYLQLVPLPPAPLNLAAPIVGIWLLAGIVIAIVMGRLAPELLAAGRTIYVEGIED